MEEFAVAWAWGQILASKGIAEFEEVLPSGKKIPWLQLWRGNDAKHKNSAS
jgi:hypothetical protein